NKKDQHEALPLYEEAWPLWVETCLRYPRFAGLSSAQEDVYEAMLRYVRLSQKHRPEAMRAIMLGMAQMSVWPHPNWEQWRWIDAGQKQQIVSNRLIRVTRGPLELVAYYD